MSSVPLNHLLKIGADALQTTAQTLSGAINELVGKIPTVSGEGTASGSAVHKQKITVGSTSYDIDGTTYMELTQNLGHYMGNIFTFSNAAITENSVIDYYTSDFEIQPESISVANGTCVITVPAGEPGLPFGLTVRIYIK